VVVAVRPDHSKHLVAFYSGSQHLDDGLLRDRLGESLPEYMIPSTFHWREQLPLTANSKIDKKTLTTLAAELTGAENHYDAPTTPTEIRLAAGWAKVLGIPQQQIGRRDHFFDRGGTSLSAVKLAITLDRAVSLKEVTAHPVLADLAGVVDGRSNGQSELLQALSESNGSESNGAQAGALVCFPYAGGNAVNFQPMAKALRDSGLAVYAVELPGHDVGATRESFAALDQVVERVVAEINRHGLTTVLLWGHSSGAALAVETARRLQRAGTTVPRVFLGAQLLGAAAERRAAVTELNASSNAAISERLSADGGYTELGELDAERAEHVAAAYRHDYVSANRYFAEMLENPPPERLSALLTVVVAADDPITGGFQARHRDWELLAEHVELHELPDGGHYFPRTRPAEAGKAVLQSAGILVSP
jgi:surfactin synthase thioesterase subunit